MRPSYSTIALMAAILGTFVGFACSQMSPVPPISVYNPILFKLKPFQSMFDKPSARFVPKDSNIKYAPILKKSDASWEDLGWAWGKRSAGVEAAPSEEASLSRASRSLKQVKKNPDWHDLGWAWGRK